jgi:hypothetical protein
VYLPSGHGDAEEGAWQRSSVAKGEMVEEPSSALPMDGNNGEASPLLVLSRASPHGREREGNMSSRHRRTDAR